MVRPRRACEAIGGPIADRLRQPKSGRGNDPRSDPVAANIGLRFKLSFVGGCHPRSFDFALLRSEPAPDCDPGTNGWGIPRLRCAAHRACPGLRSGDGRVGGIRGLGVCGVLSAALRLRFATLRANGVGVGPSGWRVLRLRYATPRAGPGLRSGGERSGGWGERVAIAVSGGGVQSERIAA